MGKIILGLLFVVSLPFIFILVRFCWRWTNLKLRKAEKEQITQEYEDIFKR